MWNGKLPKWTKQLKQLGEIGVIKKLGKLQKLDNKGTDGVMIGYEKECEAGTYRMMNLKTGMINITRDVKWMNMTYDEYKKRQKISETEESTNSILTETSSIREKQETKSKK